MTENYSFRRLIYSIKKTEQIVRRYREFPSVLVNKNKRIWFTDRLHLL